jgi:hypothetical protein
MEQILISFDVDGTLIRSIGVDANAFHKRAFSYAMSKIYGVDGTIDAIKVGPCLSSCFGHQTPYTGRRAGAAQLDGGVWQLDLAFTEVPSLL